MSRYIDLSQQLFDQMPVFPGDPEVEIKQIHTLPNEGWNLRTLFLTTHLGTHVNVPVHMMEDGKSLDDFRLSDFIGEAVIYEKLSDIVPGVGLIFRETNIDQRAADLMLKVRPKFVGLSESLEFDLAMERYLLQAGIISYENLANLDKVPKSFRFYGVPLNIKEADGSPVRAFAEID